MEKIDKISAALIIGIVSLVVVSGVIVYQTWIDGKDKLQNFEVVAENTDGKMTENTELVFNDDTSVTNNSGRKIWLRVKVLYYDKKKADKYEIVSAAAEKGEWKLENDRWYYYSRPIEALQNTKPLIDNLLYEKRNLLGTNLKAFRLQAEAVDEAWLVYKPKNVKEAFDSFKKITEKDKHRYL